MYKQLERGKWIQSFRYKDVDGKTRQKQVRGKTKKETDIAKNAFLSDLEKQKNETAINSSNPLFDDFISDFLLYKEGQLKRSTYTTYIYRINNHIIDYFSGKRIRDINIKMIVEWKNSLNNLSVGSKNTVFYTFKEILKYAELVLDGYKSGIDAVQPFRDDAYHDDTIKYWTFDQFLEFDSHVQNYTHKVFFRLLYFTGMRRGEAVALTWDDVDLDNNTISINKTYSHSVTKEDREKGITYMITTPKSAHSIRTIKIPDRLAFDLKEFKKTSQGKYLFGGDRPVSVFAYQGAFKRIIKKTGLPPITLHGLRHSHASFLINNGANVLLVSRRLGHSSVSNTIDIYAHLFSQSEDDMIDIINKVLTKY